MQTVLIAEDSPRLRQRLDEELRRVGYFTILAQSAQEALGVLRSLRVDLLLARERLTDVEGSMLARIARRRGLDELVVVLLADDVRTVQKTLRGGVADAVLARDLDVRALVRVVRRLLRPVVVRTSPPAVFAANCAFAKA